MVDNICIDLLELQNKNSPEVPQSLNARLHGMVQNLRGLR